MLAGSCEQATAHLWTVETWLGFWLSTRRSIRPSTARTYRIHVDKYLVPALGQLRLAELSGRDIARMFAVLAGTRNRRGRVYSPAMLQRIRATLRAALNAAIREGLIRDNPARRVELANPRRPHAVVWTDRRVTDWQATGEHPTVAVWTAAQLAYFLHAARGERFYPLWWLVALRGLRRGEACGLRWVDVDLDQHCLSITQQLTYVDGKLVVSEPKSRASRRVVALDPATVQVLHAQARRQRADAAKAGDAWQDTGYVFTRPDGTPLRPDSVTQRTRHLIGRTGLPPVRLHDLRHGAASLAHAAGADLKTVQDQLGHASIVLTADTYTSVLDTVQHAAARNTAQLVLCAARKLGTDLRHQRPTPAPTTAAPPTLTTVGPPNRPSPAKTPRRTGKVKARRQRAQSKKRLHRTRH
jgi:integrase